MGRIALSMRVLVGVVALVLTACRGVELPSAPDSDTPSFGKAIVPPVVVSSLLDGGPGTLRQAIIDAPPGGKITFADGLCLSDCSISVGSTIEIDKELTINGPSTYRLSLAGTGFFSVFGIIRVSGGIVSLKNLTITGGSSEVGGGIEISMLGVVPTPTVPPQVWLDNVRVTGNSANFGGGIRVAGGDLIVTNSSIDGNLAGIGGGIDILGFSVTLSNTSVTGNQAFIAQNINGTTGGGGIYNDAVLTLLKHVHVCGNLLYGAPDNIVAGNGTVTGTNLCP